MANGILLTLLDLLRKGFYTLIYQNDPLKIADKHRKRGMKIGKGTYIYPNVVFGRGGKDPIRIGENCVLTGCTVLGHDASTKRYLNMELSIEQEVVIEDDCFIGYGAIVLMGVRVGEGSIIGSGAVVTSDVPAGSVVGGNPARVICTVEDLVKKRKLLALEHPEYFPSMTETISDPNKD